MAVSYKDISELLPKSSVAGTEKIPVSDTEYITPNQIAALAPGGDTSACVHKTGDETVGGDKTFTDDITVGSASNIKYSSGGGGGFTRGKSSQWWDYSSANSITIGDDESLAGEPKAFILTIRSSNVGSGVLMVVGDSTGVHGIYNTGSQHNYSAGFTKSYSNGILTITAPTGVTFISDCYYDLVYYYGSGSLTFKTSTVQPGSGVTAVTLTGTDLTEVPTMYAIFLESAVNNESYRRVAGYTNSAYSGSAVATEGITFLTGGPVDTTSSFTASYNNGLYINSGGTNAGGYFHNPGTYTLYYLMASDVAGGGGSSFQNLGDELDDIRDTISGIETLLAAI